MQEMEAVLPDEWESLHGKSFLSARSIQKAVANCGTGRNRGGSAATVKNIGWTTARKARRR